MRNIIIAIALPLLLNACGFEIVDTGHRGIETNMGKVVGESLEEGFYWYNPMTSDIVEMDVRTNKYEVTTSTYTKDIQQANLTVIVNYNLDKTKAHIMYKEVGRDWAATLIPQVVSGALKDVVGKWTADDLISNRDKASQTIGELITSELAIKNVTVTGFQITNIDYADEYEHAVEAKVVAIQRAVEAQNKTKQIQEEATQKVISAKAEAESMRIRAEALSQNKNLVQYEAVQKWDGKMPVYMLGDSTPLINLKGE